MHTDGLPGLVRLDRRAVSATVEALAAWDPVDAGLPTPCAEWTIADLVAHMTVQHRGFARAVRGERTVAADWAPSVEAEPITAYRAACEQVGAAFAGIDDAETPVLLPEVRDHPLPAGVVVGFHLVDNVVHAWDIAKAVGADVTFDEDVLAAALAIARAVPDDDRRDRPGAAFKHARPVSDDSDQLAETLLLLGRDPGWMPT